MEEIEDGAFCRICHDENSAEAPLFSPCLCSGSIKHIHQDCLMQWLKAKSNDMVNRKCELCQETFVFHPVYKNNNNGENNNEPPSLSVFEFVGGILPRFSAFLRSSLSLLMDASLWLIAMPCGVHAWIDVCTAVALNRDSPTLELLQVCEHVNT